MGPAAWTARGAVAIIGRSRGSLALSFTLRAVLAGISIVTLASQAGADPALDARGRFEAGVRLFRDQRYADARQAFEEAYRIMPNDRVLANIAACLSGEGRAPESVMMYRRFLSEGGDELPARARDEARREIARLRPSIADVALAIEPAGAEVRIDGRVVGVAPLGWPVAVSPGQTTLEVRAEGYAPFARAIDLERGASVSFSVVLQPLGAAAATSPSGEEPAPVEVRPAPPREEHAATAPVPRRPRRAPATTPIGRGPLLWTGVAATAALAVAATVTGLVTLSQKSEYEDEGTSLARRRELYDSTPTWAGATDTLADVAIGTAVATALLFAFGGPSDDDEALPTLSLGGAPCCGLTGSF